MCVDYTGLNKACPKVPYPLPRIDQIVDSTAGCETLSFLDAYSGYHQIRMKESDQLATSFITPFGMYCYVTMPFDLRNASVTYQRCMNHVFGENIGRTVEAYMDDIVVKTRKASDLLSDLEVTFRCLKAKGVKLNPEKCVFGVPRGMLLGSIVSERSIETNPEKIAAITSMGPIKDLKGVQRVMGCLAALGRFISRLGERGLPLYRLLRKAECFTWTPEAEEALGNLKALLANAPILVPPLLEEQAKIASGRTMVPSDASSRDLHQPSIKIDDTPEPEAPSAQPEVPLAQFEVPTVQPEVPSAPEGEALRVEEEQSGVTPNRNWQTPHLLYLHRGELPLDRAKARRLARRTKSFVLLGKGKELHHRSPSGILQ
jgi:hypothetical protein